MVNPPNTRRRDTSLQVRDLETKDVTDQIPGY